MAASRRATRSTRPTREKVLGRAAAARKIAAARARGQRVVFTNGCYDILHVGHLRSLEQAKTLGDVLVVGVNRDRRVRELKGPKRPVVPDRQRAELLAGLVPVDYVVLFGEDHPAPLIRALRPDIVCKGSEYRGQDSAEKRMIESLGGRFVLLRQIPGVRSSRIIEKF